MRLNVWDFGGQEFMHATHQFFLTKRSLYLVVLNARQGQEQSRLHYWLNLVQSFGGDAPIIVVVNQIDQQPLHLNRRELYQKYQSIKAFVHTSCKTGDGLDELRAGIIKEVGQLEHIHDKLLLSWFAVKEQLEGMEEDYIEYRAYEQLCEAEEIDAQSQETLIHLLHHLGVVLNFRDDPRLSETNVLNPRWVTEAFYAILNHRSLFESKGVLKQKDLPQILDSKRYPRPKHNFILDLMGKFELSFPLSGQGLALNGEHQYLIPDLLPKEEPDLNWSDAESLASLAFQYHYNFLPGSIISRFMLRMNGYIKKQTYWRSGVVLTYQGNEALVKADKEAKKIFISVIGNDYTRREFLAIIRAEFDRIHQTIEKLSANQMVPLPKHNSIVIERSYLLELLEIGEESFIPPKLKKRISVRRLLEGVEPLSKQQQEQQEEQEQQRNKWKNLTATKTEWDNQAETYARRVFGLYIVVWIGIALLFLAITIQFGYQIVSMVMFFVGLAALGPNIFFFITGKEWSRLAFYELILERRKAKLYREAEFDVERYEELTRLVG